MATIRIRTEEPDFSSTPTIPRNWEESVHGKGKELTPHYGPTPLGKHVVTIIYHDDNLCHNFITGRSVTGMFHVMNKTPTHWCSKKQSTIGTVTQG